MAETDNRHIARDSLLILAELRLDGDEADRRVKVRNLSSGGLMAEGDFKVARGMVVWINLRNLGWTEGSVAWVQDNRFGVAFRDEIDPKLVRAAPVSGGAEAPALSPQHAARPRSGGTLRKIL